MSKKTRPDSTAAKVKTLVEDLRRERERHPSLLATCTRLATALAALKKIAAGGNETAKEALLEMGEAE